MVTLSEELKKHKGIGPGFDFLRIALAVSIVSTHCLVLTGNLWMRNTPLWYTEYALVPMFFALSGFLVSGSAMRLSLGNFLINRGLRIFPALAVDIAICALVIGPIVTTYPLSAYFSDKRFFEYFINVTGWIHYLLPGVFEHHIVSQVNGALWTVPYEMLCYVIMSFFIITRGVTRPGFVAWTAVALFITGLAVEFWAHSHHDALTSVLKPLFVTRGSQLLLAFLLGILGYQLRDRIPYSWPLFYACCVVCVIGIFTMHTVDINRVPNRAVFVPPLVYMTVFLGLTRIPIPRFLHRGDYSYGIYLYHNPFLQIMITLFPATVAIKGFGALLLLAIGLPVVFLVACGSWHFVEKPILSLRKRFSFVARVRGVETDKNPAVPQPSLEEAFGKPAASHGAGLLEIVPFAESAKGSSV